MTSPGFFEIYPDARPALPAGLYTTTTHQQLTAAPPHGGAGDIHVDDTAFYVHIDSPRYTMPPDQILSTFPPAGSQGDWRERLPQIVLKRRTLPWERNPGPLTAPPAVGPPSPDPDPATAPPWLALVVLAEGEGRLSTGVDVAQCVTSDVNLGPDADVPQGKYLEVSSDVVEKVFPCLDELQLLCHVRKVDLSDTELALGDDDGYLAVVLSNRLPQPAPPTEPGGDPQPLKYTAYLVNLERQLPKLLPTEPVPVFQFNALEVNALVNQAFLAPAPNATVDQLAMGLGAATATMFAFDANDSNDRVAGTSARTELAPYAPATGLTRQASAWATGPVKSAAQVSSDVAVASEYKFGVIDGINLVLAKSYRFPVLVSWDFICTGTGGFERLMNDLDVGLLGTSEPGPPPMPEVAATGHVALSHRTRLGEAARSWYRGPLSPQPTVRTMPTDGVLPLAHTGDQLRKVVPDGREDISLAAMFEIGRLLALSKPTLVASLMDWRRELFGAARARELTELLAGGLFEGFAVSAVGGRNALEDLIRSTILGGYVGLEPGKLAPGAQQITQSRVPAELASLSPSAVIAGLGADPGAVAEVTKEFGLEGLGVMPVTAAQSPTVAASQDQQAMSRLQARLSTRVDELTLSALKIDPAGLGDEDRPATRSRRKDSLDRLIDAASPKAPAKQGKRR